MRDDGCDMGCYQSSNAWRQRLLSNYTGPSFKRVVHSAGGAFLIALSGPGVLKVNPPGLGGVNLRVFGTTTASTLAITQIRPRWHFPSQYLVIDNLTITSHQLGGLDAGVAELNGPMTPLMGAATTTSDSTVSAPTALVPLTPVNATLNSLELGGSAPKRRST